MVDFLAMSNQSTIASIRKEGFSKTMKINSAEIYIWGEDISSSSVKQCFHTKHDACMMTKDGNRFC